MKDVKTGARIDRMNAQHTNKANLLPLEMVLAVSGVYKVDPV